MKDNPMTARVFQFDGYGVVEDMGEAWFFIFHNFCERRCTSCRYLNCMAGSIQ